MKGLEPVFLGTMMVLALRRAAKTSLPQAAVRAEGEKPALGAKLDVSQSGRGMVLCVCDC